MLRACSAPHSSVDFAGQVAVITGGSGAVGGAVARMLAARGARVVVGYHTHQAAAEAVVAACGPAQACAVGADLRTQVGGTTLVRAALDTWTRLDVLVSCAGSTDYGAFDTMDVAAWDAALGASLDSVFHVCRAASKPMLRQRRGRIVLVTGLRGVGGMPGQAAHSAADGGVLGAMRALARELAPWSVTVNAVALGLIDSSQHAALPPDVLAWCQRTIALRRLGTPEEAAAAAVFLASPLAGYITGQTLAVDGGWRMG